MSQKVLIVTALAGFIRSFLDNDISILQDMGYEVHCAANANHPGSGNIDEYFARRNTVFHQIDFCSDKPISAQTMKAWKQTKQLMSGDNYTLIHVHTPIAGVVTRLASYKNRKNGTKIVYTTHGFYFHKGASWKSWLLFYPVEKLMSLFTDTMITINNEDFNNAKKMWCNHVKHINGVGVDTERFMNVSVDREEYRTSIGIKSNDTMVLAVGELSPRKNHQIIIKALAQINDPNIIFVICGNAMTSAATTEEIRELAREMNVRIMLLGLRKDIPELCKCADIGVMPSSREGLGLAGIEMLSAGLPVVASNVHGILDYMTEGITGFLSYPYDVNGFEVGIKKLCNKNVREVMKSECVKVATNFDKSVSYSQMHKIYHEIVG